jgi:hypothetical protein
MDETNLAAPAQTQEGTPAAVKTAAKNAKAEEVAKAAEAQVEAEHKERMRKLEMEAKELEILERQVNLQDAKDRIAERQMKREQVNLMSRTNGASLKDTATREAQIQSRCNHRKGGEGIAAIQFGMGVSPNYAVIKHTMLTSDMWIRCQRCGKTWKPPIRKDYELGGDREKEGIDGYTKALVEYETARNFNTNNTPSSSQTFSWSDGGAYAREVLKHTNLR